ncbi:MULTISPECIES: GntR family transcriptional regulator [Pseudomonas]|jgi:GntR family transcriptional regulator|uniref:GntR family transcriptional regulator n=1 Tax=Pseudomonas pergaminensis TaxID=2853159 RepID=A0ABD7T9Q6_9PSED|nr:MULTISPECIES: GntR family transcriptional regulator [Pseudomonas]AQT94433.1 GntR family transcriptional regulator [Pseudomonas azotoformans]MBT1260394.1 GntR family transcriptional regulator [Pseudomonas sp. VS40]MBT1271764.1 GntR family transcriptional regulator [Pseudomonas sp. VS59]PJK32898.1 GntR family transcriptional regulator [Pseudomonas sp. S09F 262]PJK42389.1 GntR family transcriptional regulator [Pseudomonas sp. S10E 269]
MNDSSLSPLSSIPLHAQLRDLLRSRILDGEYAPNTQMPSESELGVRFKVSRITVRQALGDLQKEGLIYKIHGKGTFVSKPKAYQNVSTLQGLAESMTERGYEVINRLRSFRFVPADKQVAERLGVEEGTVVAQIKRVRLINREPVSLEITYLPQPLGERLEKADLVTRDIFLILENDCGLHLGHADVAIDAVLADSDLTQALNVEPGSPIMHIERLTHTADGQPVDFEHLYYRGDAFQYRLRIDRERGSRP